MAEKSLAGPPPPLLLAYTGVKVPLTQKYEYLQMIIILISIKNPDNTGGPMTKLRFLCSNHRSWLSHHPAAAAAMWAQAYSQALELREECKYAEAVLHAGAAFETADLLLAQQTPIETRAINRFSDSAALLAQLLYQLREGRLASAMLGAAVNRLESLSSGGTPRSITLAGCQRLMRVSNGFPEQAPSSAVQTRVTHAPGAIQIH